MTPKQAKIISEWWDNLDDTEKKIVIEHLNKLETKNNKIMSLQVKGRLVKILDAEEGVSKADKPWKKQSFVIDTGAQYNPEICFQVFGEDRIEKIIAPLKEGTEVDVFFNLSSREYNGKYFHNVDAWKVNAAGNGQESAPAPQVDNAPAEDDDLPF